MSEKHLPHTEHSEHKPSHEDIAKSHEHHERAHKHLAKQAEHARHEKSKENIEKIRELARVEAETSLKVAPKESKTDETESLLGMQHSLKSTAYKRTLARAQQKLPKPARAFSQLVHNPGVDKVSAVSAQTVARPSGLLGGSICAFIGSLIALFSSKYYGFKYNYLLLFILFAGGFLVGIILELALWLVHGRKQHYR